MTIKITSNEETENTNVTQLMPCSL